MSIAEKSYHPYSLIIFLIPFQIRIVLQRIYCRRFAHLRKNGNLCENFLILMLMSMCFGDLLKHFPTESRQRFCLPLFFLMNGISYLFMNLPTIWMPKREKVLRNILKRKRDSS